MRFLLLLFVVVPAIELLLLVEIGRHIGTPATLLLIAFTGVLGASLARWQGLGILRRMQEDVAVGRVPADSIVDGVLVLLAGAVLMTPGVITDIFGFLCLVPVFRNLLKRSLRKRFEGTIRGPGIRVVHGPSPVDPLDSPNVRNITPNEPRVSR